MRKRRTRDVEHLELGLPEVRPLWETGGLFSDHYLNTRLRQNDWWPSDEHARAHWEFCRDLYNRRYLGLAKYGNEASVRQELIDKVLKQIGFDWIDNLSLPDQDAEPDYLLFGSATEKEAVMEKRAADRYRAAAAILEAKKLNHPLSQLSKHQLRYPHQQIRDYLLDAQVLGWGILTNGNAWRLYCRDAKRHEYFEINFEVAIQSLDAFKTFLALFGPEAFRRRSDGRCRLDDIRDQAVNVQTELEENLRQRVFAILTDLANGFAARPENGIGVGDLEILYQNCLIYLYRLLFVLYAEGRDLLPVNRPDRKYMKNLSLARLRSGLRNFSEYDDRHLTRLCESLRDLFRLINGANERMNKDYGVPRYNGGLFDPEKYPLLEQWAIADADLATVLRGLMFSPPPERDKPALPIQTVDFADLRVQHLGSIYEGLLEHRLVRGEYGRLCLDVDRAERKATGTYYTPDYIVKYIVENAVGPLLKQIEESAAVKAAIATKQRNDAFAEQVLSLNILDPAMGSGHFLVEAVTFLADHIVHHPTTRYLDADKRGEPKAEQEIAHWRRRVVEACIYGVDLNPLAVELAKLSLWLVTIATDKPLNFLDHHLRCGNSLIGARLDDLSAAPVQKRHKGKRKEEQHILIAGAGFKHAVADVIRGIHAIEGQDSDNRETVKGKEERWHKEIEPVLRPFSAVADLWTSAFFGREMDEGRYVADAQRILSGENISLPEAAVRRFFHWELAFPEVFFNEDGSAKNNPGFDSVIGNPPWGAALGEFDRQRLADRFAVVSSKTKDSYVYFICQAIEILRDSSCFGLIVPNTWMLINTAKDFRRYLLSFRIREVIDHGDGVFQQATVESTTLILVKTDRGPQGCHAVRKRKGTTIVDHEVDTQVWIEDEFARIIVDIDSSTNSLLARLRDANKPFGEDGVIIWGIKPYQVGYGIPPQTPAMVEKRVYHANSKLGSDWKPLLVGSDVNRYSLYFPGDLFIRYGEWLMYPSNEELMVGPKLLMRQTSDILRCCYDEGGYYCQNSVFVVYSAALELKYLLSLLNSRLLNFVYMCGNPQTGKAFAEVKPSVIKALPIRRIEFTTPDSERNRHGKKVQQGYEASLHDGDPAPVLSLVDEHMKASRTDVVHDLLAFLAERMTSLNKEKHEAAKGFLTDLKDFHGVDAHGLKPKTRLDEFWTLEVADVFAHIKANARTLAAQGVRLKESDEEKIRSRFQGAKDKIVPLEGALAFTDRLIDRIVYRLYDLTPEEIRIVEDAV